MALAEGGRIYWREWREDRWRLEARIGTAKGRRGGASRRACPKAAKAGSLASRQKRRGPPEPGAPACSVPPRPRRLFERGRAPHQTRSVLPKAAGGPAVKTVRAKPPMRPLRPRLSRPPSTL